MRISDWSSDVGSSDLPGRKVKIGVSIHPEKRLRQLQAGSPVTLHILVVADGGYEAEARWHAGSERFRLHNEWFRLTPGMIARIRDRKRVVSGKRVSVRVDHGGSRDLKNTKNRK